MPRTGHQIAYQVSEDGSKLCIASRSYILSKESRLSQLEVREIRISGRLFGDTVFCFRVDIPGTISEDSVSIRDPYVSVMTSTNCFMIDWRERAGVSLVVLDPDEEGQIMDLEYDWIGMKGIVSVVFHPVESSMILVSLQGPTDNSSGLFLTDIPLNMPPLDLRAGMSELGNWLQQSITPRELPSYTVDPVHDNASLVIRPIGFKKLEDRSWVFEVVVSGMSAKECEEGFTGKEDFARVLFDLERWSQHTDVLEYDTNGTVDIMGNFRNGGALFVSSVGVDDHEDEFQLVVPEFGNGSGYDLGWMELEIPRFLESDGSENEISVQKNSYDILQVFDSTTGHLYVCVPTGIVVIQYYK
ncbi:hypothetical protein SISSUDRAFT_1093194 [Sistotremastrum suecicum HHB10207 ss-3]|uniref:NudC domain-containing protein 1 n=1 Tax=Sistotremastrum suecicum HHB10207 ss-3 TaxID=1314776 RepID=A0A166F2U0_9AGAM|nr:hypothetical protein SISSUDRAFT_1093194 [Sistotremastrum suecicum HHB10207 ss-3]